uniref:C2H2-type domain-containing protein n=1 Tax=Anopheles christyi TaxID=43041 RepID=A0A182JZR8_9DIPT
SKQYLATNLLLETLTLNLDSYAPGPKKIDAFTLGQVEQLMKSVQQFLSQCKLVPFEGDELERDKIMQCFYQQPNTLRCRHCNESLYEYNAVAEHIQMHDSVKIHQNGPIANSVNNSATEHTENVSVENLSNINATSAAGTKKQKEKEAKPKANYLKKICMPNLNIQLSKYLRQFLKQDINALVEKALAESDFIKTDSEKNRVLDQLVECLKPHYPKVKCYPFGSRIVGTGTQSSDLDVFVDLQEVYYGRNDKPGIENVTESIERVEKILRETQQWTIDEMILNARVPLLKVISHEFDIKCDLTFSNGLAHRNSLLLEYLFNLQPKSRMLVCYLKKWNREKCLNGYTISLMVIFLFQLMECLPSVSSLQQDPQHDIIIDGWNAGFATPTLEQLQLTPETSEIKDLAGKFFELYSFTSFYTSFFSLETEIISPFNGACWGTPLLKRHFKTLNYSEVPPKMVRLIRYMQEHQNDMNPRTQFAYNKPLVVQDPFELAHNVAKSIPVEIVVRIVRSFELSVKRLNSKQT